MTIHSDAENALACIAEVAGCSFASVTAAMDLTLSALTRYLHCRSSLVAHVGADDNQVHIIAACNSDGGDAIAPGSVIVPATTDRAFWMGERLIDEVMPITTPLVGYAVGVPICLADGTHWGHVVCLDAEPLRWSPTRAFVLRVLARRLADEVVCQRQRESVNTMKGDFVSIVSHEFRTALMSILGFSQMLRDEPNSLAEVHEFATDIFSDATRINRMITDMLDLDRMESGNIRLTMTAIDLNVLLRESVTRFAGTTPNHRLLLQIDPMLPSLVADSDKLIQIITNLLSNAIKYSPQGGEIVVGSASDAVVAHIWVRDQGMGIPIDALERIFERYARVEARTSRYIQGTGLGLPIVRQLARMHGGHAWAESIPGKGSTFHVTVPLAQAQTRAA